MSVGPSSWNVSTKCEGVPRTSRKCTNLIFARAAELADDRGEVVRHQGEVALAERDAVGLARHELEHPPERVDARHDPAEAADGRDRRVVGMQREAHTGLLGHRDHPPQEVLEVLPERRLGGEVRLGPRRCEAHRGLVVLGRQRAAPRGHGEARAGPAVDRDPVVTEGRDAGSAHRAQLLAERVELLLASWQPEADAVERGRVLDRDELEARLRVGRLEPARWPARSSCARRSRRRAARDRRCATPRGVASGPAARPPRAGSPRAVRRAGAGAARAALARSGRAAPRS